jgi:hypothetical protein
VSGAADDVAEQSRCLSCGNHTETGYGAAGGGEHDVYEFCEAIRYRPPLPPLRCEFVSKPPRWLVSASPC